MTIDQPTLCGAFALDGASIDASLPPSIRDRMRASLSVSDPVEYTSGCAWLAGSSDTVWTLPGGALAAAGLVVQSGDPGQVVDRLRGLLDGTSNAPPADGHYVLVYVSAGDRTLLACRDAAGGERLCYLLRDNVLLFASSVRVLLASDAHRPEMDAEAVQEAILARHVVFGDGTFFKGVSELRPAQGMIVEHGRMSRRWLRNPLLASRPEKLPSPAALRRTLEQAVERGVGDRQKVALGLSGGLDSSTVAALAVRLLGAGNVEAFTWEYLQPGHPSDASYAAETARMLGIRHHVVPVSFREYLDVLPEMIWRLETPRLVPGARILLSRAARERGYDRILDGVGLEALLGCLESFPYYVHLGDLEQFNRFEWLVRAWRMSSSGRLARVLRPLRPLLRQPIDPCLYLTLCVLRHNGRIREAASAYPAALRPFVQRLSEGARVSEAVEAHRSKPLGEQLLHFHFHSYKVHRFLGGQRMALSADGPRLVSPCTFSRTIEEATLWSLKGGRRVHREAMRDELPQSVLARPKILIQAMIPRRWRTRIAQIALPALAPSLVKSLDVPPETLRHLESHFAEHLATLALWREIHVRHPAPSPPSWGDLGLPYDVE